MKILTLIIKREYYDKILSGDKRYEYRDITPRSQKKYCQVDDKGYVIEQDGEVMPRHYDAIRMYVGYRKDRASALVSVKSSRINLIKDDDGNEIL